MNFYNLVEVGSTKKVRAIYIKGTELKVGPDDVTRSVAVQIPLENGYDFVLIMPQKSNFSIPPKVMAQLINAETLNTMERNMKTQTIDIKIPMINHRSIIDLKPALQNLGIEKAFENGESNFSGINGKENLFLSSLLQINRFQFGDLSNRYPSVEWRKQFTSFQPQTDNELITFDRPFLYILRDAASKLILFVGQYQ